MMAGNAEAGIFDARVQAVLQEAHFIRQEILDNIGRQHRTTAATLALYGALLAFAWKEGDLAVLVAGPMITLAFAVLWSGCQSHLDASSLYLRDELEKRKWVELIGERPAERNDPLFRKYWVGWQHYFDRDLPSVREDFVVVGCMWVLGLALLVAGLLSPILEKAALVVPLTLVGAGLLGAALVLPIRQLYAGSVARRQETREVGDGTASQSTKKMPEAEDNA